ncbi:MAG: glycosyltransferase family 39 protein [Candidatus Sulfotelmatobacter sp.]
MPTSETPVNAAKQEDASSPANYSTQPLWTRSSAFTLTLLAAAAAVLRFLFLARKPFWFDECFSVEVARLSWHDSACLLWRREANMSLYYLLLRGWLHFGSSPFFIRSLSVIISLATLPAIFWLAHRLFDRRAALIAVALISCNAYHIRYAQEARSYSLFVLLATLSSGFFVAALPDFSHRNRRVYIFTSILAVYSHLYAVLLVAAHRLSVRRHDRTQEHDSFQALRRAWLWIGIGSLPLLIFAAKTGAGPIRWIQRPGIGDLLDFAERISGNHGFILLLLYAVACAVTAIPSGKITWALRTDIKWSAGGLRFLWVWLLFPVAVTVVLSLARPLFLGRYFIFCLPALVILAAAGLARLRTWLFAVTLATILLLSLNGTFSYYHHDFDLERDGSQAASNYILDQAQPGDAILFHIAEARVPYEFFKSIRASQAPRVGEEGPEIMYPRHGDWLDYRDFTGKPSPEFVKSIVSRYSRVWLVLMSNENSGHPDATTLMLNQVLGEFFPHVEKAQFPQVVVKLYSKP